MKSPYDVRRRWLVPGLVEEIGEAETVRPGFGFAFRRWQHLNAVTALMPLHLAIAAAIAFWVALRFRVPMWLDRRCRVLSRPVHEAFLEGWDRGAAAAREDMARREEAVRKLRAEVLADAVRAGMSERDAWNHAVDLSGALRSAVSALETMTCDHDPGAPVACEHRHALSQARLALRRSDLCPQIRDRQDQCRARYERA